MDVFINALTSLKYLVCLTDIDCICYRLNLSRANNQANIVKPGGSFTGLLEIVRRSVEKILILNSEQELIINTSHTNWSVYSPIRTSTYLEVHWVSVIV